MDEHSHDVTLVKAPAGALILLCVIAISFLPSSNSSALAVDPILDTVLSVTNLEKTENSANKTNNGKGSKNRNDTVAQPTPSRGVSSTPGVVPVESDVPLVTEPLRELPTIDTSDVRRQPTYVPRADTALVATSAVLGVKTDSLTAPLQASDEGWKLFGAAWYWWILGGGAIYYMTRHLINLKRRRIMTKSSMVS